MIKFTYRNSVHLCYPDNLPSYHKTFCFRYIADPPNTQSNLQGKRSQNNYDRKCKRELEFIVSSTLTHVPQIFPIH